jgi:hypothetical protein
MIRTPGFPDVHVAVFQYAPTPDAVEVFAGFSEQELREHIRLDYENDPMIRAVRETLDFPERKFNFRVPADGLPGREDEPDLSPTYHVFVPLVEGEFSPDRSICHGSQVGPILGSLFNRYNGKGFRWSALRFDLAFCNEGAGAGVSARFRGEFITR